jgi:hypothetical protein
VITVAGAHDQQLVPCYAVSVFMSFLVGLLAMARLARRKWRHKSAESCAAAGAEGPVSSLDKSTALLARGLVAAERACPELAAGRRPGAGPA